MKYTNEYRQNIVRNNRTILYGKVIIHHLLVLWRFEYRYSRDLYPVNE